MKFIIEGSQSELTELIKRLGGIETEKKKDYIPPLLTELAEDEKINEPTEAVRNADKENAPQVEVAEQEIPFLVRDLGNRGRRKRLMQTSCGSENQTNDSN